MNSSNKNKPKSIVIPQNPWNSIRSTQLELMNAFQDFRFLPTGESFKILCTVASSHLDAHEESKKTKKDEEKNKEACKNTPATSVIIPLVKATPKTITHTAAKKVAKKKKCSSVKCSVVKTPIAKTPIKAPVITKKEEAPKLTAPKKEKWISLKLFTKDIKYPHSSANIEYALKGVSSKGIKKTEEGRKVLPTIAWSDLMKKPNQRAMFESKRICKPDFKKYERMALED